MPELPEVETVRNYLIIGVKNKTITNTEILDNRIPRLSKLDLSLLKNQKIIDISRKGKYLLFIFEKYIMISHLRMEGKYYLYQEEEKNSSHVRVIFHLDNNTKLIYDDVRRFGTMELYHKDEFDISIALPNVNKEPWDYNEDEFYEIIIKQKGEIKAAILNQAVIAGIGNIYADEILYRSRISPFKNAKELTKDETTSILIEARKVLEEAIKAGGSTIRSYHPSRDISGRFQQSLFAYDQAGKPCSRCKTTMIKRFLHGRGTTYCPKCQHVSKVVAIYGKIASGKSTLVNLFRKDNFPCFSADEEVDKLYKKDLKFTLKCVNLFHEECLNEHGKVSKEYVKQVVIHDENKKKELENIIHPLIEKKCLEFIKKNYDKELIILEIPLLFEANMEYLADYIVAIDASIDSQIRNLKARKSTSISSDLLLNSNHSFDKNIKKCHYIIHNNDSLNELKENYIKIKDAILNN